MPLSGSEVTGGARSVFGAEGLDWYASLPAAPAARIGDLLVISGQVPLDDRMNVVAPGDLVAQARYVFDSIGRLLSAAGASFDDVVDVIAFTQDPRQIGTVLDVARAYFERDYPAWSTASFLGSYVPGVLVCVQAIAQLGPGPKECFTPDSLSWWGSRPVSGGCRKGDLLFVSAQSAIDPDGNVRFPGDHCAQARASYEGILEIVGMAGGSVDDILDFTSFHQDLRGADATFTDVYMPEVLKGETSDERAPSTSHVGTPGLEKPGQLGAFRAVADLSPGPRTAFTPELNWWKNVLPLAGGVKKENGRLVTVAGQVACAADQSIVAPGDTGGQVRYILTEIREVLEGFGGSLDNVLGILSFHKDPRAWEEAMQVAAEVFPRGAGPAWTAVSMPALWMEGYLHEIAAIAVV
ncbi:MAG TPA: Rid family hydrolase [Gaiella sp.]|nr:Rid family hydrolase [Gaiella sp.]